MKTVKVAERVSMGSQPSEAYLAQLGAPGTQVVINLRREGEESQPLTPEAEARAARAYGLAYYHVPVSLNDLHPEQVAELRANLQASTGSALVHCGAGQRACALTLAAVQPPRDPDEVMAEAERAGFPVTDPKLRAFLQQLLPKG